MLNVPSVRIIQMQELHHIVQDTDMGISAIVPVMQVSSSQMGLDLSALMRPAIPEGRSQISHSIEGAHDLVARTIVLILVLALCLVNVGCSNVLHLRFLSVIPRLHVDVPHRQCVGALCCLLAIAPSFRVVHLPRHVGLTMALADSSHKPALDAPLLPGKNIPGSLTLGLALVMSTKLNQWNSILSTRGVKPLHI